MHALRRADPFGGNRLRPLVRHELSATGLPSWATRKIEIDEFPNVKRWLEEIGERPAVKKAMAMGPEFREDPASISAEEPIADMICYPWASSLGLVFSICLANGVYHGSKRTYSVDRAKRRDGGAPTQGQPKTAA